MSANTSPRLSRWVTRVQPLFRGSFVAATGLAFLLYGGAMLITVIVLLARGRLDLALPLALAVALIEGALMAAGEMRLRIPLTALLLLLGPVFILLVDFSAHFHLGR